GLEKVDRMPESQYRARQVGAKTQEVVEYHHDESLPGKPLHILIPGGLVALAALAVIILVGYQTWFKGEMDQSTGLVLIVLLAPFYVGGVFLFSYGYELYNIPRAIRLTAIIVFLTVAAVVIVAVLFFVLGSGKGLSESSSEKKSSGKQKVQARPTSSSGPIISNLGPLVILGGPGQTREVTREVTKEVEVPVAPRAIDCPYCGRSYVPADQNYACPACGAATPPELIEQSQARKDRSEN
ncbi:MAG TPA: zinc ribbon domain-containing protein, partial [Anaerolineales bacterium]|nr:zinc ribbon domain-containing protein [Anaerolineales bacterium]